MRWKPDAMLVGWRDAMLVGGVAVYVARYEQEFAALTFSGYTQGKQGVLFLVIAKPNSSIRVFPTTLIWVNDR
jgi:hypothetical protein